MTLRTRPPTGRVPWPLILIEGGEKSGKSWACAQFSTSPRIGQMYWIDLGEGAADEYGAIPGANYLVVEHDGTWAQIQGAVDAVKAEAQRAADAGQPPVVLVIDSMTAEWDMLKDWANDKARRRHNAKATRPNSRVKPLADDEEPVISMDLWNEANARHRKLMTALMTFPGIVLVTARGKDVAALDEAGKPIERQRDYRVEGHKTLGFDVSCWIRLDRAKPGSVIGVRSVHVGLRPGYDEPLKLARDWSVEGIVFDTLRCLPDQAQTRDLVRLQPEESAAGPDPAAIRDWCLAADRTAEGITRAAAKLAHEHPGVYEAIVTNEHGDSEVLAHLMERAARDRTPVPSADAQREERRRKRMHALFNELGLGGDANRARRLRICSIVLNLDEVQSTNDLDEPEVEKVIAELENRAAHREKEAMPA